MTTHRSNPGLPTILPASEWKGTPVDDRGRFMNIQPFRQSARDLLKWQTSRNRYREEKRREKWAPPVITDTSWIESLDDCILWRSKRGLFDTNSRLWGAFVIRTADKCIYFSGDSGYDSHFRDAQQIFGSFDYAILGIGAFEPVWFMRNAHEPGRSLAGGAGPACKTYHPYALRHI